MARRKNTKFIDPRYFMDEKMERLDEAGMWSGESKMDKSQMGKEAPLGDVVQQLIYSHMSNANIQQPQSVQDMFTALTSPRGIESLSRFGLDVDRDGQRLAQGIQKWWNDARRNAENEEWSMPGGAGGSRVFRAVDRTDSDWVLKFGFDDSGKFLAIGMDER